MFIGSLYSKPVFYELAVPVAAGVFYLPEREPAEIPKYRQIPLTFDRPPPFSQHTPQMRYCIPALPMRNLNWPIAFGYSVQANP